MFLYLAVLLLLLQWASCQTPITDIGGVVFGIRQFDFSQETADYDPANPAMCISWSVSTPPVQYTQRGMIIAPPNASYPNTASTNSTLWSYEIRLIKFEEESYGLFTTDDWCFITPYHAPAFIAPMYVIAGYRVPITLYNPAGVKIGYQIGSLIPLIDVYTNASSSPYSWSTLVIDTVIHLTICSGGDFNQTDPYFKNQPTPFYASYPTPAFIFVSDVTFPQSAYEINTDGVFIGGSFDSPTSSNAIQWCTTRAIPSPTTGYIALALLVSGFTPYTPIPYITPNSSTVVINNATTRSFDQTPGFIGLMFGTAILGACIFILLIHCSFNRHSSRMEAKKFVHNFK
jgi:hypothetical protein